MYLVVCPPVTVGNQYIKTYWCGGRQWEGTTKLDDSEMTPELLTALENDSKVIGHRDSKDGYVPILAGPNRITVEHLEGVAKPKPKAKPKAESKSDE